MLRFASIVILLLPFNPFYGLTTCEGNELTSGEVTIRFYKGKTIEKYNDYPIETASKLISHCAWNFSKPTVIFVHGLHETVEAESTSTVVNAYLGRRDHNVLALSYGNRAAMNENFVTGLPKIKSNSTIVGALFAKFIDELVAAGVDALSIHLVAYNIGAHVAGYAARTCGVQITRLTALDPYIHGFYLFGNNDHLWSTDAKFVDVIHTNGVILSVASSTGTVDFYPNSGYAFQPGCPWGLSSDALACSSRNAYKYYAESVTNPESFPSVSCDSWSKFTKGSCSGEIDYMGFGNSMTKTGDFYLQTNGVTPYDRGNEGIVYESKGSTAVNSRVIEFLANTFKSLSG